jgi:transcriptional antiterminator NusG
MAVGGLKWYVIHTYSGYEHKVKESLVKQFAMENISDKLGKIEVPMEDVKEFRGGKQRVVKRKFFPGYVLIQLELNDKVLAAIKESPRVTGFLGGSMPTPLPDKDVKQLMDQLAGTVEKPRPKVAFQVGDAVRVVDGPFTHFSGRVEDVNPERGKVKLMVSIFGRATPVELDFPQIEKV